jgi:hypothetical protein
MIMSHVTCHFLRPAFPSFNHRARNQVITTTMAKPIFQTVSIAVLFEPRPTLFGCRIKEAIRHSHSRQRKSATIRAQDGLIANEPPRSLPTAFSPRWIQSSDGRHSSWLRTACHGLRERLRRRPAASSPAWRRPQSRANGNGRSFREPDAEPLAIAALLAASLRRTLQIQSRRARVAADHLSLLA